MHQGTFRLPRALLSTMLMFAAYSGSGAACGHAEPAKAPACVPEPAPTPSSAALPAQSSLGLTTAERERGDAALERFARLSDDALRQQYITARPERRLFYRRFDRDLADAYRRALSQGTSEQRALVERVLRAALGDLVNKSPAQLASMITDNGSADVVNLDMRDATLHLAMLARITRNESFADGAAALLARFAEAIPKWPIWNSYEAAAADKKAFRQEDPNAFRSEYSAGLWGGWIYFDLMMGTPLLEASVILEPTGAVERTGATRAIRAMFDLHLETQRRFDPNAGYTNMDGFQIRGYIDFGRLLREPELVHEGVRRLENMYRVGFYPDGWWQESSTAYHSNLQTALEDVAQTMLAGYSDPPGFQCSVDGRRFDSLNLTELVRVPSARANFVLRRLMLPDGTRMAVHDTDWPDKMAGVTPPQRSYLFGAAGQGSLISGRDDGYAIATLHWGPSGPHAHADALHLNLWAKGTEAISETSYRPLPGSNSTRAWHTSTAGHATVVVDGVDQAAIGPRKRNVRQRTAADAVPGVPDWRWRWNRPFQDGGELRLFSTRSPDVQVIEADATRAYDAVTDVTMYRRTIALVRIDNSDSYVVDIFRVKGGSSYDYMLHAALQLEQQLRLSLRGQPMTGSAHTMLTNLEGAVTDGPWLAAFEMANGVTLLTFMAAAPDTTVIQSVGPAMRRLGDAPFVIARRSGPETTFVAVHHIIRGTTPRIQGIELLPTQCAGCVALKVRIGARTDTVISCTDRSKICEVPGNIEMRGLFAHIAGGTTPDDRWAFLVDGDLLRTPEATIEGETSFSGTVRGTLRLEAGDAVNGFIVDETIPEGASLADCAVIVDQAGEMSWAYGVGRISRKDGATVIETPDEPGLIVTPGEIKQTYFPGWGFRGEARYRVPGDAFLRPGRMGANEAAPTGSAKGSWSGAGGASTAPPPQP